jgi:hypothetical protein
LQFEDVEGNIEEDQASLFAGRRESQWHRANWF